MLRAISKLLSLAVLLTIGIIGIALFREHNRAERELSAANNEIAQLNQVVTRLTDEHRVAEMLVTDQKLVNGIPQSTLLFVEYGRNGSTLAPKTFTIKGDTVHLDAMVVKFDHEFVKQNNPLKGHSIALFTKIYGNHQSPDEGTMVDQDGHIPDYYQGIDPRVSGFENKLWADFWKLADEPSYRQSIGVRALGGEGKWWPCTPDHLYTITIEADGGLNVTSEPVKGIYREALRQKAP